MDGNIYLYKVKVESYKRSSQGIEVNISRLQRNVYDNYLCVKKMWEDFITEVEQQLVNELNIMQDGAICRMIESDSIFKITLDEETGKFITNYSLELDSYKLDKFSQQIIDYLELLNSIIMKLKENKEKNA